MLHRLLKIKNIHNSDNNNQHKVESWSENILWKIFGEKQKKGLFGFIKKKAEPKASEEIKENPFSKGFGLIPDNEQDDMMDSYQRMRGETVIIRHAPKKKDLAKPKPKPQPKKPEEMDLEDLETEFTRIVPTHRNLSKSDINQKVLGLNCDFKKTLAYVQLLLDYNIFDFTCKIILILFFYSNI